MQADTPQITYNQSFNDPQESIFYNNKQQFHSQNSDEQREIALSAMSHLIRSSFAHDSQKGSEIRIQDEDSTLYAGEKSQ